MRPLFDFLVLDKSHDVFTSPKRNSYYSSFLYVEIRKNSITRRHHSLTNHKASDVASNSDVPAPFMVDRIYNAAFSSSSELLTELEKVYLLGQSQKSIFSAAVECAIACQNICAIENLFKVDVSRVRHLTEKDVDVNGIGPNVISPAIQGERTDVEILRLFLDLGLDVRKVFGNQGDALMWAVRIGRWELIQRILDKKGSFNVDEVKVGYLYPSRPCSPSENQCH
jgi:ankyrin repeat protein